MMLKKEDRRVQRTINMVYDAFLDLLIEKGYEVITVQDIIDRANIGRSTFYSHFVDKEQLLISSIDQLRDFLKQQSREQTLSEVPGEYRFGFCLPMLQHAQSHKRIYKATVGKQSGGLVIYHMQRMLIDLIGEETAILFTDATSKPIPQNVAIEFVVNTFFTLLTWWMEQEMPCTATELDRMFHKLTLFGLSGLQ